MEGRILQLIEQTERSSALAIGLVGLACIAIAAAASAEAAEVNGPVVESEFIYTAAPYPACHASTLVETVGAETQGPQPASHLLAAWFGGTHERHPDVGIWVAHKTDRGWSKPVEVANGVTGDERFPTWNPVLFQAKKGPLLLFYKVGPTPRDWWGMLLTSHDGGRTWSAPQRLPDGIIGPVKNKPIELPGGVLLCPSSSEDQGWRVHFESTNDNGQTWSTTGPVNDPDRIRAIQPSLLVHPGGRMQAVGRTRQSGVFQIWSEDRGETWGEMKLTGLPNPSSGTDAVTLADGRHLLVYNHSSEGRSPLNVAISDDGLTWRAALVLEDDPTHRAGYSYPAVIQTSDGLVHISYTWRRERIKHVVVDPERLSGPAIVDGKWPAVGESAP